MLIRSTPWAYLWIWISNRSRKFWDGIIKVEKLIETQSPKKYQRHAVGETDGNWQKLCRHLQDDFRNCLHSSPKATPEIGAAWKGRRRNFNALAGPYYNYDETMTTDVVAAAPLKKKAGPGLINIDIPAARIIGDFMGLMKRPETPIMLLMTTWKKKSRNSISRWSGRCMSDVCKRYYQVVDASQYIRWQK